MERKKLIWLAGGAVILALGLTAYFVLRPVHPVYSLVEAASHDLTPTVRAHGVVAAANNVDLSFDRGGRVAEVYVKVGTPVVAGDKLVALENSVEAAQLAAAQAALNQRVAGATAEQIASYQAAADAAKASLQLGADGSSLIVSQAKQNEITALTQSLPVLSAAFTQADNIVAVDNVFANDAYRTYLSTKDKSKLYTAATQYSVAKTSYTTVKNSVTMLTNSSPDVDVAAAANEMLKALNDMITLLADVSDVLDATNAQGSFTQTTLDTLKATITGVRSTVAAQYAAVQGKMQATDTAATTLAQRQAVYNQALATFKNAADPAREVDLAPLRAAVATALATYNKTIIRSPITGTVSRNDAKVGSVVSANVPLVSVVNNGELQIETYVSEKAIGTLTVGEPAAVTVDAFGDSAVFPAVVTSVDQSATVNGGSQSYKVVLGFAKPDTKLKAGMNANIVIHTAATKQGLAVPESSVLQRGEEYYVLVPGTNGQASQHPVTIGTKGDGWWEVLSGLQPGDKVLNFGQ